ncbi:Rhamnogalacturonide transporter RhiT [Francisella salina]|uniref:Rhamnogalacturonide transporter RhiT n=2 Tax=Francisella salina TaxID=573569 RepID=A0ABM5MAM6_FRAST|nr:Rhamnogalacturonide transporter RhiT [Francisella salina]
MIVNQKIIPNIKFIFQISSKLLIFEVITILDTRMMSNTKEVKFKNMVAYGSGDFFGGGAFTILGLWLMYFYTDIAGLSAAEAGLIVAIGRGLDVFADPIMGYISDNWRGPLGRRRFFFVIGAPLVSVFALLWIPGFGFWYYLFGYIAFNFIFTMIQVPYETLAAEMTDSYHIRSKMTGIRMVFSQSSNIVAGFLPAAIMYFFADEKTSFIIMGVICSILFMLPWFFVYKFTWERKVEVSKKEHSSLFKEIKFIFINIFSTLRVRAFRLNLLMYIGAFVALDVFGASFAYYFTFILDYNISSASIVYTCFSIIQVISVPIFAYLCIKVGSVMSYRIAISCLLVSMLSFLIIPMFTPILALTSFVVIIFVLGFARAGCYFTPWNIYNFIADIDEALTTKRREGTFASTMTVSRKLVQALAFAIVGFTLSVFSFKAGVTVQSSSALLGINICFIGGTILFCIIGAIASSRLRLTQAKHSILVTELERLRAGGELKKAPKEAINVVEELTGWPHQKTWGHNNTF